MPRRRDDDDHVDDPPRRPRRRKKSKRRSSPLLLWTAIGIIVLVVGASITVGVILFRDKLFATPAASSDPALIGYWSFDDAPEGRIGDGSGRGNDLLLYGARLSEGKNGKGVWLDGRPDQYCEIPAGPEFDFGPKDEFTIAGWFKCMDGNGTIVSLRHSQLPTQVDVLVRNGRLQTIVGADTDVGRQANISGQRTGDGHWNHFVLIRYAGFIELYQNGAMIQRATGPGSGPITTDLRAIGCQRLMVQVNDMRGGRPGFNGCIDEVSIYRRALSESEIAKLLTR